jgi:hypothetical protein
MGTILLGKCQQCGGFFTSGLMVVPADLADDEPVYRFYCRDHAPDDPATADND